MINIEKIKPTGLFTNYIYKAIPLAFDETMSYYETLCGLLAYLKDTVIPTVNNNADAVIELQNLMEELQNYVDNYFEDLSVQEQINNKLDAMAESGELAEIINQEIFGELNERVTTNTNNITDMAFIKPSGDTTGETDITNIQTALNTYRKIRLTNGNYYINRAIKIDDHMTIEGNGISSSIINCVGDISAFERNENVSSAFMNLKDFRINADPQITSTKTGMNFEIKVSEGFNGISYSNLERIYINGFYNGFFAEQFWNTKLEHIRCNNCSNYGIWIGGRSNNILLNTPIAYNAVNGIRLTTSPNQSTELTNINIINADLEYNAEGIHASAVFGLSVTNTYSEHNTLVMYIQNCPSANYSDFYSSYDDTIVQISTQCKLFNFSNGMVVVNKESGYLVNVDSDSQPINSKNITIRNLANARIYITNKELGAETGINPELLTFYKVGQGSIRYGSEKITGTFNLISQNNNKFKFRSAKLIVLSSSANNPASSENLTLKINDKIVATKYVNTSTDTSQFAEIELARTTTNYDDLFFENGATFELSHSNTMGINITCLLILDNIIVGQFY